MKKLFVLYCSCVRGLLRRRRAFVGAKAPNFALVNAVDGRPWHSSLATGSCRGDLYL